MFNLDKFGLMKKAAVVVNTARGPIIKTGDLVEALRRGLIAGAGIDVFEKEPPPADFELLKMDNAVLSPHIAWYSEEGGQDYPDHDHGGRQGGPAGPAAPSCGQHRGPLGPQPQAEDQALRGHLELAKF